MSADRTDRSGILLCLSHLRWDFVYQRPQHLLTRAARDYQVVFFEEPIWEDCAEPHVYFPTEPGSIRRVIPILPFGTSEPAAEAAQRQFVSELTTGRSPLTLWYYTPMAVPFTRHLEPDLVVYDCMDELSAFRGAPPGMRELEQELLSRADLVFTGGRSLYEAKRDRHHSVHAFPSSIDAAHFRQARDKPHEPPDQAALPHPRLGYFGVIDERMDTALLAEMADLRPDWQFVMIGPVVKIDEAELPRRPNIHWLGGRSYDELPAYLSGWDIGLMPFALNESTRYISPTKTPEYLAAGVPVVCTPIRDIVRTYGDAGLVEIVADAREAVAAAEALLRRPRQTWLTEVDKLLARSSWDGTWEAMHELMRRGRRNISAEAAAGAAPESLHV